MVEHGHNSHSVAIIPTPDEGVRNERGRPRIGVGATDYRSTFHRERKYIYSLLSHLIFKNNCVRRPVSALRQRRVGRTAPWIRHEGDWGRAWKSGHAQTPTVDPSVLVTDHKARVSHER